MSSFPLKIMTPDGTAFDGQVQSVSCRTITGQVQLMARHIDYCTALGMGEAHITLEDGTQRSAACMGGMLSMFGGECRLLNGPIPLTKNVLSAAKPAPRNCWPRKTWMPVSWNLPRPA